MVGTWQVQREVSGVGDEGRADSDPGSSGNDDRPEAPELPTPSDRRQRPSPAIPDPDAQAVPTVGGAADGPVPKSQSSPMGAGETGPSSLPPPVPLPPFDSNRAKPWWKRRRWVGAAAAVVAVMVWNGVDSWWQDRQADQAKDELREQLAASGVDDEEAETFVQDLEEAVSGLDRDEVDFSDEVVSDEELRFFRATVEGIFDINAFTVTGDITEVSDDELRELMGESCALAGEAETAGSFLVAAFTGDHAISASDVRDTILATAPAYACRTEVDRLKLQDHEYYGVPSMELGSHQHLDLLVDGCRAGAASDCDMLWLSSAIGSEYEMEALTCGGANDPLNMELTSCVDHHDDRNAAADLERQCEVGFNPACDLLWAFAAIGSDEEHLGATCGNRRPPIAGGYCVVEFGYGSR